MLITKHGKLYKKLAKFECSERECGCCYEDFVTRCDNPIGKFEINLDCPECGTNNEAKKIIEIPKRRKDSN